MIVLDSDIVTLLSYGQTDKLQQRMASVQRSEELVVTIISCMEILRGRFDGILKAANENEKSGRVPDSRKPAPRI
jgi:predicted nucleic acid-binding protein